LNGKTYDVDENGFLDQPLIWNDEVAADLAATEGISGIAEVHRVVVRYIRDHYLKSGIAPMVRKPCKETGYTLSHVYELFPSGPANSACKVAGLPKPTGCV
jgi:TusE/DsrC/DsvC family sulfur relay protein